MKFKMFGTEIYISFLFTAVIAFMLATDRTGLALPTLCAVLLHETGHLLAMWTLDCNPKSVSLIPASVKITMPFSKSFRNDIIIAVCGPAVNFLVFGVLYFNYLCFGSNVSLYYGLVNLLIGLFNSMPVKGLDGGTVLFTVLAKRGDANKAALTVRLITVAVAIAVIVLAILVTVKVKFNPTLYIVGIYLLISAIIKI